MRKNSMRIIFRVDASIEMGTGHVMRCLTLADELTSQGHICEFICREHQGHLGNLIQKKGYQLHLLQTETCASSEKDTLNWNNHAQWLGVHWQQDAEQTCAVLKGLVTDWLVVDHYALDLHWEQQLKTYTKKILVIDDLADRQHQCDLLIDSSLQRTATDYDSLLNGDTKVLSGTVYCLLRDEFWISRQRMAQRDFRLPLKRILISLGGVDFNNVTASIIEELEQSRLRDNTYLDIVLGHSNPHYEHLLLLASQSRLNVHIVQGVDNMADRLILADLSIGAVGGSIWERLCLGCPSVVAVIADNQVNGAKRLESCGAIIKFSPQIKGELKNTIDSLKSMKIKSMSKIGMATVDGMGSKRVVAELLEKRMKKLTFSKHAIKVRRAKSIYINELVYQAKRAGKDPIVLSLGEAYFDIPNFGFDNEMVVGGYHYSDSQGLPSLRKKLSNYFKEKHSVSGLDPDKNIIISMGSKALTYMTMLLTLNEGDEILLHEPAWLSYEDQASLCGASTRYLPYQYTLDDISHSITDKTKLIVINNPNNPAGWVYNFEELQKLIASAEERGVFVLVDEAYSDLTRNEGFRSAAALVREHGNLIVVNSISKNFGMSGWRVGFAAASEQIIQKLIIINQHMVTCAPTMLQLYIEKNFDEIWSVCNSQIDSLLTKREQVRKLLDQYGFRVLEGGATFYFFVELWPTGQNASEVAEKLLTVDNIAVVPGEAYGKTTSHFVRLSFGTESLERIGSALQKISARVNS